MLRMSLCRFLWFYNAPIGQLPPGQDGVVTLLTPSKCHGHSQISHSLGQSSHSTYDVPCLEAFFLQVPSQPHLQLQIISLHGIYKRAKIRLLFIDLYHGYSFWLASARAPPSAARQAESGSSASIQERRVALLRELELLDMEESIEDIEDGLDQLVLADTKEEDTALE